MAKKSYKYGIYLYEEKADFMGLSEERAMEIDSILKKINTSADYNKLSESEKEVLRVNSVKIDAGGESENGWWVAKIRHSFKRPDGRILTWDVKTLKDEIPFDHVDWSQYDGNIIWWAGLY